MARFLKLEKLFLAASISVAFHGIIFLLFIVLFLHFQGSGSYLNPVESLNRQATVFWANELKIPSPKFIPNDHLEDVPFTAQLSPIALLNHDVRNAMQGTRLLDMDSSLTSDIGGKLERGCPQRDTDLFLNCFKSEWPAEKLAVVIDRSLSMGLGGGWENVIRGFESVSSTSISSNQVRIWLFDKSVDEVASTGLWSTWNAYRSEIAIQTIRNTRPGGHTDLAGAIRVASLNGATRIVVISDDATLLPSEWTSICATMRRLGKPLPRICSYRILGQHLNDSLETKCRQSGGWSIHGTGKKME